MPIESFIQFIFVEAPHRIAAGDVSPAAVVAIGLAGAILVLRMVVSLRGDACTIDKRLKNGSAQIVGRGVGKASAEAAHGSTCRRRNYDVGHRVSSRSVPVR